MGLKDAFPQYSYYGRLDGPKPIRSLAEDIVKERKQQMMEELKLMEERIKRHITECKREIIREMLGIKSKKEESQFKKEVINGKSK